MDLVKAILDDVRSGNPQAILDRARNFDPGNYDHLYRLSGTLLALVAGGVISLIIYAQLTPEKKRGEILHNTALGPGSEAIQKPGAPPLPPPTEVVSLRIYPIKSCRGIELDSTRLRKTGLTLDRNWMFVSKADRKFMTIRSNPSMTLIDTEIIEQDNKPHLQITIHGTYARVIVPAFPTKEWLSSNTTLNTVEIWEKDTDGYEYSDEINKVFTDFFNMEVSLIYKGPEPRNVAVNGREELYGRAQNHLFADVMSLQVASEASMNDLNRRLKDVPNADQLTIERFRPNIIVRGRDDKPWEEDTWKRIRLITTIPEKEVLYKLDLDVVARCARCQVPNVNPDTADKHPKQPWEELMKFRRVDQGGPAKYKPCFGMLCVPKNEGIVQVGARLEVLETTDKHSYNTRPFAEL